MSDKRQPLATVTICAAWAWLFWSPVMLENVWLGIPLLALLSASSYLALRHVLRTGGSLGLSSLILSTLTLALGMFTAWAMLISSIAPPVLPESVPVPLRLSSLFLVGPIAAAVVAALFVYPLAVLLPRLHWVVPVMVAASVGVLQYESIIHEATRPLTRSLMVFELACLSIVVPLLMVPLVRQVRGSGSFRAASVMVTEKHS